MSICNLALPYLKASASDEATSMVLKRDEEPMLRRFAPGVVVGYLVDRGNSFQYVQRRDATTERISEEQLHQTAVRNLTALARDKLRFEKRGNVFAAFLDGNFEAALLLIDELWDQGIAQLAPNGFVAAIPARDMLAFCDASFPEGIAELRQIIARVTQGGDHLITTMLLSRDAKQWSPYAQPG